MPMTEGDWEYREEIDYTHGHKFVDGYSVVNATGELVAEIYTEDDARAIAQLPKLIDALDGVLAECEAAKDGRIVLDVDVIRDVLAAARGE